MGLLTNAKVRVSCFILVGAFLIMLSCSMITIISETPTADAKIHVSPKGNHVGAGKGSSTNGINDPNMAAPLQSLTDKATGIGVGIGLNQGYELPSNAAVCVTSGVDALHDLKTCSACKELHDKYKTGEVDELYSVNLVPDELVIKEFDDSNTKTGDKGSLSDGVSIPLVPESERKLITTINLPIPDSAKDADVYVCEGSSVDETGTKSFTSSTRFNVLSSKNDSFVSHPFGVKYRYTINTCNPDDSDDGSDDDEDLGRDFLNKLPQTLIHLFLIICIILVIVPSFKRLSSDKDGDKD